MILSPNFRPPEFSLVSACCCRVSLPTSILRAGCSLLPGSCSCPQPESCGCSIACLIRNRRICTRNCEQRSRMPAMGVDGGSTANEALRDNRGRHHARWRFSREYSRVALHGPRIDRPRLQRASLDTPCRWHHRCLRGKPPAETAANRNPSTLRRGELKEPSLRGCLKSIGECQSAQHQPGHGGVYPCFSGLGQLLIVLAQIAVTTQPCESALHDPAAREDLECVPV